MGGCDALMGHGPWRLSRRQLLRESFATATLLSAVSVPDFAWAAQPTQEFAKADAVQKSDAIAATSDLQQHLEIDVLIDAQGPFRFVVDTGADRTVIADDVAQRLSLPPANRVLVEGIVRTIPAGTVRIRSLSFGSVEAAGLVIPVLPRALIGSDGYLGLDVIDGHSVTFDFLHRSLKVEYSTPAPQDTAWPMSNLGVASSSLSSVPASGPYGHLRCFNCHVDGVAATAFIDSGAQVTIGNFPLIAALRQSGKRHPDIASILVTGVTGGSLEGRITAIREVKLKGISFRIGSIVAAGLQIFDLWGLSETPALLIGMNYLRKFSRVTVDYGRKEFLFELADLAQEQEA